MKTVCCTDALGPLVQKLLDAVTIGLVDCGRPACRYFISTDVIVAEDVCCDCSSGGSGGIGQAWVQVVSITPDPSPAYQNGSLATCGTEMQALVNIGVHRCAPSPSISGEPPTAAALTSAALGQLLDASVMRSAVRCLFTSDDPDNHIGTIDASSVTLGAWTSIGADGGCLGGQQAITIRFFDYACGS